MDGKPGVVDPLEASGGVGPDPDEGCGLELGDGEAEMLIAGLVQGLAGGGGQFIRGKVGSGSEEEGKRAIVEDEALLEAMIGGRVEIGEKLPEAPSADLGTGAGEALNGAFGMLVCGRLDIGPEAHPLAYGVDFAERDTGLGHTPRARIHAEEEEGTGSGGEAVEVGGVALAGVIEGIVDRVDRFGEGDFAAAGGQVVSGLEEGFGERRVIHGKRDSRKVERERAMLKRLFGVDP